MKIQTTSSQTPLTGLPPRGQTAAANTPAPNTASASTVDLSPAARQLSNLQNADNDIDVDRVNALRAAIADGRLVIDPGRVADKIIASARDLLR